MIKIKSVILGLITVVVGITCIYGCNNYIGQINKTKQDTLKLDTNNYDILSIEDNGIIVKSKETNNKYKIEKID